MEITIALKNHLLQGYNNFLAVGSSNAFAELYEGTTLLATVILAEPFGEVSAGVLTLTPTPEALISTSGVANSCVFKNGDGAVGWVSTVSDLDGDGEVKLVSTQLYAGGYTRLVSGTIG